MCSFSEIVPLPSAWPKPILASLNFWTRTTWSTAHYPIASPFWLMFRNATTKWSIFNLAATHFFSPWFADAKRDGIPATFPPPAWVPCRAVAQVQVLPRKKKSFEEVGGRGRKLQPDSFSPCMLRPGELGVFFSPAKIQVPILREKILFGTMSWKLVARWKRKSRRRKRVWWSAIILPTLRLYSNLFCSLKWAIFPEKAGKRADLLWIVLSSASLLPLDLTTRVRSTGPFLWATLSIKRRLGWPKVSMNLTLFLVGLWFGVQVHHGWQWRNVNTLAIP